MVRLHSPLTMETLERENSLGCCHVWLAVSRWGFTEQCGTCQVEWMWYYTRTFNEIWEGEEERLYNPVSMQQQNVHRERDIPGEKRREDRRPQLQSLRVLWRNHGVCLILSLISFQILQLGAWRDFWPLICLSPLTLNLKAKNNITT